MSDTTTLSDVAKQANDLTVSANIVWTLVTGFLVMFMQAGFALVETGLTRSKNVAHTMAMNFLVYSIGILGFWVMGFAFQMGGVGAMSTFGNDPTLSSELTVTIGGHALGLVGLKGFFLTLGNYTPGVAAMFLFQMVFMDTTATIPTGAMAERWKFISFVIFSFVISTIIYPIFANWTWGGGWLSQLGKSFGIGHGHCDFAGSSVVHMTGGVAALVGAKMIGPRVGKYNADGSPNPIPGHNIPMALLGTFILAFGWFGFNPGSTLSGTDNRIAIIAVNTMLASASGAFGACVYVWLRFGKPDPTWLANGMLAGLVAITAPCAFVGAPSAVLIGAVAGVLVVVSALFIEQTLKIDDPVGASSVHGALAAAAWSHLARALCERHLWGRVQWRRRARERPLLRRPGAARRRGHRGIGQLHLRRRRDRNRPLGDRQDAWQQPCLLRSGGSQGSTSPGIDCPRRLQGGARPPHPRVQRLRHSLSGSPAGLVTT